MNIDETFDKIDGDLREIAQGKYHHPVCHCLPGAINYIGVNGGDIKKVLTTHVFDEDIEAENLKSIGLMLLKVPIAEHKLAGLMIVAEKFPLFMSDVEILDFAENLYAGNFMGDWNINDRFSERVLAPLIDRSDKDALARLDFWSQSHDPMMARASLGGFVRAKSFSEKLEQVFAISATLIKKEEKFVKTIVGTVMSLAFPLCEERVVAFLKENSAFLIKEVIASSLKNMEKSQAKRIKKEINL